MLSRKLLILIIIAWMGAALLTACSSSTPAAAPPIGASVNVDGFGVYTDVTPAELAAMLQSKDFLFVNTHIPYEGEIEPTDAFIAFEESGPQRVSEYPADKSARIVLYCRSGRMSTIVAGELVKAGYTQVWNLDGGMIAWEKAGYKLVHK
jgi:rhodanese-related sulfurtransferase